VYSIWLIVKNYIKRTILTEIQCLVSCVWGIVEEHQKLNMESRIWDMEKNVRVDNCELIMGREKEEEFSFENPE